MNYRQLIKGLFVLPLFTLFLASCDKKEEESEEENRPANYGSVVINDSYSAFPNYEFSIRLLPNKSFSNTITLSRPNKEQVRLTFPGSERGSHKITPGDSSVVIAYQDAAGRPFRADTGKIHIYSYSIRDGVFKVSGGFEFNARYRLVNADTSYWVYAKGRNGSFVNLTNNRDE